MLGIEQTEDVSHLIRYIESEKAILWGSAGKDLLPPTKQAGGLSAYELKDLKYIKNKKC